MSARAIDPIIASKIDALDLSNEKKRLMDPKRGKGWSQAKVDEVEKKYKNFLKLISLGDPCTPSIEIDFFWHECILFTKAYRTSCQEIFGHYVDHYPETNDKERTTNKKNWKNTLNVYKEIFGESISSKG